MGIDRAVTLPICNREIASSHLVLVMDCPQLRFCDLRKSIRVVGLHDVSVVTACSHIRTNVTMYDLVSSHSTLYGFGS